MFPGARAVIQAAHTSFIKLFGGDGGTVLQVDGASPYDSTVSIRFNTDGTVETGKSLNGAAVTFSAAGDWITPNGEASSDYRVKYTNKDTSGGGDWTTEAAAEDVFVDLGTLRLWQFVETTSGDRSFTVDFVVEDNVGQIPDSAAASYTFRINNIV